MTLIVTSDFELNRVVAPRLPTAPAQYESRFHDQYSDVLRLYFNRLDNILGQLQTGSGSIDGSGIQFPYGAFQDTAYTTLSAGINNSVTTIPVVSTAGFLTAGELRITTEVITYTGKTATTFTGCTRGARGSANIAHSTGAVVTKIQSPAANTAVPMYMNTTDFSNTVTVVDDYKLTVAKSGLYNLQWSGQFNNTDTSEHDGSVWLRINGVDVPGSTGFIAVVSSHGGIDGHGIIGWNYYVQLTAGQNVQIWWSTTNTKLTLECYGPSTGPTRPSTASVVATLSFVSALPP
ncbi:MAG: hypothetical protein F2618_01445 [Actinobacteria bacterium]|nr:hypothetical protein [Actinomycetota bacterium]